MADLMHRAKSAEIDYIQWSVLSEQQWRAFSVVTITKPSKDGGGDENRANTPYDPCLGEQQNGVPCGTCKKYNKDCTGHFGIIELPFPIYNKIFTQPVLKLLQAVCTHCSRPRMLPEYIEMQGFNRLTGFQRLKAIADKANKSIRKCPWDDCGNAMIFFDLPRKMDTGVIYYRVENEGVTRREEFSAAEAHRVFSLISDEHLELLGFNTTLLPGDDYTDPKFFLDPDDKHVHKTRPESLIFKVLPVLPPLSRPWVTSDHDDGERKDDDLTGKYNAILKCINLLKSFDVDGNRPGAPGSVGSTKTVSTRRGNMKTKKDVETDLCQHVWTLIDNGNEKAKDVGRSLRSLVCRLKGKQGRLNENVAGKRVNFSARTVIVGGGIRLRQDQLGVPQDIAEILTKPEFVGDWNIQEMQQLVENAKVNRVIRKEEGKEDRKIKLCEFPNKGIHFRLMVGDMLERQLQDGDIVLFNRQPSLRIESMLAFRVKIVPGLAFMLGLVWTRGFNADFDGRRESLILLH